MRWTFSLCLILASFSVFGPFPFSPSFTVVAQGGESAAFKDASLGRVIRRYVKPDFRADALMEALRLGDLPQINHRLYEANIQTLDTFTALVKAKYQRIGKMSPSESAAVLKFYLTIDFNENRLWRRHLIKRSQVNRIFQLVKMTEWPHVPERIHGINQKAPYFHKQSWIDAAKPFHDRKLRRAFLFIQAARINHEAFHNSLAHVDQLHESFFENLRDAGLGSPDLSGDPLLALRALRVYLVSTKTDGPINRLGTQLGSWPEAKDESSKLAKFILELNAMTSMQATLLLAVGELPEGVNTPDSKIVQRLLTHLKSHPRDIRKNLSWKYHSHSDQKAIEALLKACKGKTE
jgi:hypothetical protein